jgi:signal transduction histidine kinase/CheY-like chemotaxis protein/ligand-binding sensor domain-containing protein
LSNAHIDHEILGPNDLAIRRESTDGSLWAATAWGALRGNAEGVFELFTSQEMAAVVGRLEPGLAITIVPDTVVGYRAWPRGTGMRVIKGGYLGTLRGGVPMTVWALASDGAGQGAGLRPGDAVTAMNGAVPDLPHLTLEGAGGSVDLTVRRGGGEPFGVHVALGEVSGGYHEFSLADVLEDRDGALWFGLSWGGELIRLRPGDADGEAVWTRFDATHGMHPGDRPRLAQSEDGTIWAISNHSDGGVNRFDGSRWSHFWLSDYGGTDINTSITQTRDGTVWIGGHSGSLQLLRHDVWERYGTADLPLSQSRIAELLQTPDGALWIAGLGQEVSRLDYDTARWTTWAGLKYQCETADGSTWFIATDGAVVRHYPGTANSNWIRYDVTDGLMDRPTGLLVTARGQLWAAGSMQGSSATARLVDDHWQVNRHLRLASSIDHRALFEAQDGALWFGADVDRSVPRGQVGGLLRLAGDVWTHFMPPRTLSHVYGIDGTADGAIWVGGSGLRRFDGDEWSIISQPQGLTSWIHGITTTADGSLWVGTRTYGLFRLVGGQWQRYGVRDGLSNNRIRAMQAVGDGGLWVATDKGLDRFDGTSWTTHALPRELASGDQILSLHESSDGALWINRSGNVIRYDPETEAPQTHIEVWLDKVSQPGNTTISWKGQDPWRSTPDEDLQFSWRLDDGPWSPYRRERSRMLLSLDSGEHEFTVRARDRDHNIDSTPAQVRFQVEPPVWRQPWFGGLMLLLLVVIGVQTRRVVKRDRALGESNRFLRQRTQDLEQANEEIQEANRMKSRFLANMSHELRTPLNAILGFAQLLRRSRNLPADERENVEIIHRSGEHLLTLINDVLEISRIEAGRTQVEEKAFDLHELLDRLREMFDMRAGEKGFDLSCTTSENVPRFVRCDEGKLRQILVNLLGNAVKFTDSGSVQVRVDYDDGQLHVEVEDTGRGISDEEQAVLFEAFVQTQSGRDSHSGTGLGLAISYEFARLMGGDVTVRSAERVGSVFTLRLPVSVADRADTEGEEARRVIGLQPGQPEFRILVVEDAPESRELLVRLLRTVGYTVRAAVDGAEGIDVWEDWRPQLVWMDMRMPVLDGYEATRQIKSRDAEGRTIIIALTASAFEEDREKVLAAGCDGFVRKPFREDEVLGVMANHLDVQYVYEQPEAAPNVPEARLTAADLIDLPETWRQAVVAAASVAAEDTLAELFGQIESERVAEGLRGLSRDYQYDEIMRLAGDDD